MRYQYLGSTSLRVSEIGIGCARIGAFFGDGAETQSSAAQLLRAAFHEGINFFDTADIYTQGESERIVGRAFRNERDKVIIATKGGYILPSQRRLLSYVKPVLRPLIRALGLKRTYAPGGASGALAQDFSPTHLVGALDASLKRLGTDYVDLYQLHSPPADVIDLGEYLDTLDMLKRQGKIRYYGIAADGPDDALSALNHPGHASVMTPFGILDPQAVHVLFPATSVKHIGVIARGAYGGGLLNPILSAEQLRHMTPKADSIIALRELAAQLGRGVLELSLHHALSFDAVQVTLLGMRNQRHLKETMALLQRPPLSAEEHRLFAESSVASMLGWSISQASA